MSYKCPPPPLGASWGTFQFNRTVRWPEMDKASTVQTLLYSLCCSQNYLKLGKLSPCGSMLRRWNQTCVPFLYPSWNNCWKLLFISLYLWWCIAIFNCFDALVRLIELFEYKRKGKCLLASGFLFKVKVASARSPTQPSVFNWHLNAQTG